MTDPKERPDPNAPMPEAAKPPAPPPPPGAEPVMTWDSYAVAFVERLAQARRNAYNTVPRPSNDSLEAGMFLSMLQAYFDALPDGKLPIPVPEDRAPAPEQDVRTPEHEPPPETPRRRGRHE
jgi:hypothetical protein